MKIYEVDTSQHYITEDFLNSAEQLIGDKSDQRVTSVVDKVSALQVLYQIGSNPQLLDDGIDSLSKRAKEAIKNLQSGETVKKFTDLMTRSLPTGNNLEDFLKLFFILSATNAVSAAVDKFKSANGSQAEPTKEYVVSLIQTMLTQFSSIESSLNQANAVFSLFGKLDIDQDILFDLLNQINKKIVIKGSI